MKTLTTLTNSTTMTPAGVLDATTTGRVSSPPVAPGGVPTQTRPTNTEHILAMPLDQLLSDLGTGPGGLTSAQVESSRREHGPNIVNHGGRRPLCRRLASAFVNPFTAILFVLAAVSAVTDIWLAEPGQANPITVIIIATMVAISGLLRFVQETRSGNAAARLSSMITTTCSVRRDDNPPEEIPLDQVVVGDLVQLAAGDLIPADLRILTAKDLFVAQSALTGESAAVEKVAEPSPEGLSHDSPNLAFMGSTVVSGVASGVVIAVGQETVFGGIAQSLTDTPIPTAFDKGVNSVSWLLIRFMLVMVPFVLFINGFTKGDWMEALLFAISVAVGLTPEMLPMIVTSSLAKGAMAMSKEATIVKSLNSIQNLGSMDILCTDKTGTLTQDQVVLQCHLNIHGAQDSRVLRHAFLNSYYQTGLKNLMDKAIIEATLGAHESIEDLRGLDDRFTKVDEIPFDFERRRMSVVVSTLAGAEWGEKTQMITKGAVEEMLTISSFAEFEGVVQPMTDEIRIYILGQVEQLNRQGLRVIAVAQKTNPSPVGAFSVADEFDMVLMGYLGFLDPPKPSTAKAIASLAEHGVGAKVLTGDNDLVTRTVCRQAGIQSSSIVLGSELDQLDDAELATVVEEVDIFAKLSPQQKARVITSLRANGHVVGFLGDGINDASAMKAADVAISVDTAVDIAKESADVVLLEKDLMVLEKGIIEGRRTYANMIKYIKMTASSNFGNMFSVLVASAFLPFVPMLPIHLILLNLIYDLSCTAIPWDNVDKEYLRVPRRWDAGSVGKFMVWIGPTSSVFDIATYLLMFNVICPAQFGARFDELTDPIKQAGFTALFQAGWFIESMWSQSLVIHMIRTPKLPFIESRASAPVTLASFAGIAAVTALPFTSFGATLGLAPLPVSYFAWLVAIILAYMALATALKRVFIRRYGELL
ncbi:MAG: magnesium-translocating P-type ATPase [Propionibacteriaceae bacterium]|nr:magnesium-translocating P-type ATPase [Propionibacteriaceae bacterium]